LKFTKVYDKKFARNHKKWIFLFFIKLKHKATKLFQKFHKKHKYSRNKFKFLNKFIKTKSAKIDKNWQSLTSVIL
jgi:hypothetical protein